MPASLSGYTAAVLTASDRCFSGRMTDTSGPALRQLLEAEGIEVLTSIVSPDDLTILTEHLRSLVATDLSLVLTTGGTGLSPRDNTPEATLAVCQRLVPGLSEMLRSSGLQETPFSVLSRAVCGIAGRTLILNLPGSTSGAQHGLRRLMPLLPHALELLAGKTGHHVGHHTTQPRTGGDPE